MPESRQAKALRAVAEGRVRILKANEHGIALAFRSETPDPDTLADRVYRVSVYVDAEGIVRTCECEHARHHPVMPRCSHVWLAERLWRPATREDTP